MKKTIVICFIITICLIGCADRDLVQKKSDIRYKKVVQDQEVIIRKEMLLEDFDALYNYVKEYYNAPVKINDTQAFDRSFKIYRNSIVDEMTMDEFYTLASRYLNTLNAGDIYLEVPATESATYLPFSIVVDERWHLKDCYLSTDHYKGYQILQINGVSVEEIEKSVMEVLSPKYQMDDVSILNDYASFAEGFKMAYGSYRTVVLSLSSDVGAFEIELDSLDDYVFGVIKRDERYYSERVSLELLSEDTALLHVGTLKGENLKDVMSYHFESILDSKVNQLVVDFRGCREGDLKNASHLLGFLFEEINEWVPGEGYVSDRQRTFEGHIQILVDYHTTGVAVLVIDYIQSMKRGLVIGESPSDYNYFFAESINKVLPHTGLHLSIPREGKMIEASNGIKMIKPDLFFDEILKNKLYDEDGLLTFMMEME